MEYFGQRSSFGRWVKKILNCRTYEEFCSVRNNIISELKINNLKIMLTDSLEIEKEENIMNKKVIQSEYYITRWSNWFRRKDHVPRCSNHCEGTHGNISQELKKKGQKSFLSGFKVITDYILNYLQNSEKFLMKSMPKLIQKSKKL